MEYSRYKKYYKENKIVPGASSVTIANRKVDLTKPIPIEHKVLSNDHENLIKNALVIQQRQFKRINAENQRINMLIGKHNDIMKKKSIDKIMDIFRLMAFFED